MLLFLQYTYFVDFSFYLSYLCNCSGVVPHYIQSPRKEICVSVRSYLKQEQHFKQQTRYSNHAKVLMYSHQQIKILQTSTKLQTCTTTISDGL